MKATFIVALVLVSFGASACAPKVEKAIEEAAPPALTESCVADRVQYAIGQTLTSDLQAKLKSQAGAEIVRVADQNGAITMDYSPFRLNIFTDAAKKIVRIDCG